MASKHRVLFLLIISGSCLCMYLLFMFEEDDAVQSSISKSAFEQIQACYPDIVNSWVVKEVALFPRNRIFVGEKEIVGCSVEITDSCQIFFGETQALVKEVHFENMEAYAFGCDYIMAQMVETVGADAFCLNLYNMEQEHLGAGLLISSKGVFVHTGEKYTESAIYRLELKETA